MARRDPMSGWGPSHQAPPPPTWRRLVRTLVVIVGCFWLAAHSLGGLILLAGLVWAARRAWPRLKRLAATRRAARRGAAATLGDARSGAGVVLGEGRDGARRVAPLEHAVLLLGPPRSGKTSGVIVPSVLSHVGAVVSTSTKPDVLTATAARRAELGRVWEFDPTGHSRAAGAKRLRWSPVATAGSWDAALVTARAMVAGSRVGAGTTDASHWSKRATGLLAALLHAAALDTAGIDHVCDWVAHHELTAPGVVLERAHAGAACRLLAGLANTEARERSSICSAAQDAVDAYSSDAALSAAREPNFDAARFVAGEDAIYIHAPAEDQRLVAPLICGLLTEIRRAAYTAARTGGPDRRRVLWALDEAANIAPLDELPAIASEGGGQGLSLLASFQDLSQARERWGRAADGFLTLFGTKLILPGVADPGTLDAISLTLGEYDRRVLTETQHPSQGMLPIRPRGSSVATHRERVLSPGEVANIPAGHALHLRGVRWELLRVTPAFACEPWRSLTTSPAPAGDEAQR